MENDVYRDRSCATISGHAIIIQLCTTPEREKVGGPKNVVYISLCSSMPPYIYLYCWQEGWRAHGLMLMMQFGTDRLLFGEYIPSLGIGWVLPTE